MAKHKQHQNTEYALSTSPCAYLQKYLKEAKFNIPDTSTDDLTIRKAQVDDIPQLLKLLQQVAQIHADLRPDIFIQNSTKYTHEQLEN